jgi:hypothetical protein
MAWAERAVGAEKSQIPGTEEMLEGMLEGMLIDNPIRRLSVCLASCTCCTLLSVKRPGEHLHSIT